MARAHLQRHLLLVFTLQLWAATYASLLRGDAGHSSASSSAAGADQYQWLEDTESPRVQEWVRQQNNRTLAALGDPTETTLFSDLLGELSPEKKVPAVRVFARMFYNFWKDDEHARGIWRRTTPVHFLGDAPEWETLMDLDQLSEDEQEPWVWKGCTFVEKGHDDHPEVCLMMLSRGGADTVVIREFNLTSRRFVPAPHGFVLPEAKTTARYEDRDVLLVATSLGNAPLTDQGNPRAVRRWRRGAAFADAPVVFEGARGDAAVGAWRDYNRVNHVYDWRTRRRNSSSTEYQVRIVAPRSPGEEVDFQVLPIPARSEASAFAGELVLELREDFSPPGAATLRGGSVVAAPLATVLAGKPANWTTLFEPAVNRTCAKLVLMRDHVVLHVLDAGKAQLVVFRRLPPGHQAESVWEQGNGYDEGLAHLDVEAVNSLESNRFWMTKQSFLDPPQLYIVSIGRNSMRQQLLKSTPATFETAGLEVSQRWAESKDGAGIPYLLVGPAGAHAAGPAIVRGCGSAPRGAGVARRYLQSLGPSWLARGGVLALVHLREGAAPGAEAAALEDLAAAAGHLVSSGAAAAGHLAAEAQCSDALLAGDVLAKSPQLFGAVVCEAPSSDASSSSALQPGESRRYHGLDPSAAYPPTLFLAAAGATGRARPALARQLAAQLQAEVPKSADHAFYYERTKGEGGLEEVARERAFLEALKYQFLGEALGLSWMF